MIDLTPLDVRNKRGDFKRVMRGYDPPEVDVFLELVAERLEGLVRENLQLRERAQTLQDQVAAHAGREQAVQDALVTAQELRTDIRTQSQREAEHALKEAEAEARRILAEADAEVRRKLRDTERQAEQLNDALRELERRRDRFLKEFRGLLQREIDVVDVEEGRAPLDDRAIDLDLGASRSAAPSDVPEPAAQVFEEEAEVELPIEAPIEDDREVDSDEAVFEEPALAETAPPLPPETEDLVDVSDLEPSRMPVAPPADVGDKPMSLEVELMAGASSEYGAKATAGATPREFEGVPNLETVLAEAGADDPPPSGDPDIEPPPAPGITDDNLILFDPEEKDRRR
jgi:DivIVA domain-containing protein